jgi:cysteine desulfurase
MSRIYLDFAATTPLLPEARQAMEPWLGESFGNASSLHQDGRKARQAVDESREILSGALGCLFAEAIFTSGGTEAANTAMIGVALGNTDSRRTRILISAVEHHCVLHTAPMLHRLGYRVETLPVDRCGVLDLEALDQAVLDDVLLVSVMHANNEIGTIQPVQEVSSIARQHGALFHCDAVQTFLSLPWTVEDLGADLISISAHKTYGPKGAGVLYVRAGTQLTPLLTGGGQEREMRAGTENVAAIAGFGAALAALSHAENRKRTRAARDLFVARLEELRPEGLQWTVSRDLTLPGHAHLRFEGLSAESMLILLDRLGVSASSGAACSAGSLEPSHVLLACGYSPEEAKEGLRFTFGATTTETEAARAAEIVAEAAGKLRALRA